MGSDSRGAVSDAESIEAFPLPWDREHDTTAEQLAQGRDIQGIPWETLERTRQQYRINRLQHFRNYTNVLKDEEALEQHLENLQKVCVHPKRKQFLDFVVNCRQIQSSIVHFQLRNLLWATSKHDIFLMREKCINHWDLMSYKCSEIVNLSGGNGARGSTLGVVNISTMCAGRGLVVAGGFSGQMVVKRLEDVSVSHEGYITQSDNGITNALEIFGDESNLKILTSNNDSRVRVFNAETFEAEGLMEFEWPVNYSTVCPSDDKMVAVVGDDPVGFVMDRASGSTIVKLAGHKDFSFAASWLPNERVLATGNQDLTTRVWDLRSPSTPLAILRGNMGAIRSIRFSSDGSLLAMAEPADFVHIYDVHSNYQHRQEIDLFGEISGISFSPDGDRFFVGVVNAPFGSLLEFRRKAMLGSELMW